MTRNLETADTIVKLILAISTILLYALGLIAGPFALALFVMSLLMVILLFHPNYL